jgi:hypothetical protein
MLKRAGSAVQEDGGLLTVAPDEACGVTIVMAA